MKKFAYFESNHEFPEEIITAAGFIPVKLRGNANFDTDRADDYIPNFICGAARGIFTQAFNDHDEYCGFGIVHGCDATNRQYDLWDRHIPHDFLYYLHHPIKSDKLLVEFYAKELHIFKTTLEEHYQISITPESINEAIRISNKIKKKLQHLSQLRIEKNILNLEYFEIMKYCVENKRVNLLPYLDKIIGKWEQKDPFPTNKIPIFLTGSDVLQQNFYELLEKANLRVVCDDQTLGERYFHTLIPNTDFNPLNNLAVYYLTVLKPAPKHNPQDRIEKIIKKIQGNQLQGLVSQNVKFCETFAYDVPYLLKSAKQANIRVIHLEYEFSQSKNLQLLTPLEAFYESIDNNSANRNIERG